MSWVRAGTGDRNGCCVLRRLCAVFFYRNARTVFPGADTPDAATEIRRDALLRPHSPKSMTHANESRPEEFHAQRDASRAAAFSLIAVQFARDEDVRGTSFRPRICFRFRVTRVGREEALLPGRDAGQNHYKILPR